jgi:hypothetical protein
MIYIPHQGWKAFEQELARMAERHKPPVDLVSKAAKALTHPEDASKRTIKRMAAEILDNQEWNPKPPPPPKRKK